MIEAKLSVETLKITYRNSEEVLSVRVYLFIRSTFINPLIKGEGALKKVHNYLYECSIY